MFDAEVLYGHPPAGPVIVLMHAAAYAQLEDDVQRASWAELPPGIGEGATLADGVWTNPPPPPAAPAPTSYYVPKVTFERRFGDVAWLRLQALRKQLAAYDESWLDDADKSPLLPLVRGFGLYDAADQVNVLDPAVTALLQGVQAARQVFGSNTDAAAAIAAVTTPHALPGEPGT